MKIFLNSIRIFVGILFIFSGLVKGNDPLGLAYKMDEFYEVWIADLATSSFFMKESLTSFFHFLGKHSLFLSVVMIAFEIIAGAALLLGWRMRLFSWLLLLLMIFFTFLTGYTFYTGKPTNCGCFGDCLKITSEFSFWKDVLLTVLIIIILFAQKKIKPLFSPALNTSLMFLITIFSFGLQWYALKYLPPVDCLPFKKGNNILEKRKMPADAVPDVNETRLIYKNINTKEEKNMTQEEFNSSKIWEDSTWKWDTTMTNLVKKGKNNEPPIKGFSITGITETDSTEIILSMPYSILLFEEKPAAPGAGWEKDFLEIQKAATQKNIPLFIITTSLEEFRKKRTTNLPVMKCDYTAIRTAARANPTIYLLKTGTVQGKWSYADFDDAHKAITNLK